MSIVKSFSFPKGEIRGDTYYIKHGSDSFTVIDCYLLTNSEYSENNRQKEIIDEIVKESNGRIRRFISTHPDHDHIAGIEELFRRWSTENFYAVKNDIPANKDDASLTKYIELKKEHNYAIEEGITRKWLNDGDDEHGSSGINFKWPILSNQAFKDALEKVKKGEEVNNICPIFTYTIKEGARYMWMGDLLTGMQEKYYIACKSKIPKVDILFQPHHGRTTGAVPDDLLNAIDPQIIIIGNAPSKHIDYGDSRMTITQNTAGDLLFDNDGDYIHIYSQHEVDNLPGCLENRPFRAISLYNGTPYYCGSLKVRG
ncbi:MAG: hypothetical protein J6O49_00535 [Bacteroidaceae bacterium]|nr:hypothetical protein [Bacteroidaceae bacterium]